MKTLSIIIPCFNEERTIKLILKEVEKVLLPVKKEVIIVDDASKDKTLKILKEFKNKTKLDVKILAHKTNRGKGAAIRTGIKEAKGDFIIIQDADLEYDPDEYNLLLNPILKGKADVVYGSRLKGGKPRRVLFFFHTIGNQFLTFLSNMMTNLNLTDMETCYKLFKADIIKKIDLKENRFGFEPEVTAKVAKKKVRIYEVGISYHGRTYAEGKKIGVRDGFRAIYVILKYKFLK